MQSSSTRPSASTRHKGKEIAKPVTPQSESVSEEGLRASFLKDTQGVRLCNSDPVPPRQMLFLQQKIQIPSQQGLEFLFSPLLEDYYNPTHGLAEENNNDKAPNASFQEDEFINPFCTRLRYAQEEDVDVEESFGTSARLEAVRIFVAYAAHKSSRKSLPSKDSFVWIKASSMSLIYVDDISFGSTNPKYSKRFEKLMHSRFEMSLMGEMKFFLGLQIHQSPKGIFINQAKYALEILKKHNMDNCHSIGTPLATKPKLDVDLSGEPVDQSDYRSKIGSLMYLTSSRPDLVQAGTINMGLWYPKDSGFELTAFSDADHAGCLDTRKSTSGGIQFLGDKLVSWMSKKQNCTAMSSAEAEYVALSASCAQVMWMRTQLQDYGFNYNKIPLYCDSQSAIAISCNPVQHSRTKHIHTRYHFIKEQVENGIIELYFVRTEYQLADMFTKALPEDRFKYLVRRIGMRCLTPAELEVLTNETA
ncbi:retrovirus-related pol polyprotein from transposon TNT 1-94 [Tanacetum coccineum]